MNPIWNPVRPKDTEATLQKIFLCETPIGTGVFAKRRFEPGDRIGWVAGVLVNDPGYDSPYCIDLGADFSFEPDAPFRFLNHHCDPNCEIVSEFEPDELIDLADRNAVFRELLSVEVLQSIDPGDQLTIDYCWPSEHAIPCHCGDSNCRGWIVSTDEVGEVVAALT